MFNKKGQNVVEYSILIALVVGAAIAMQTYVKRGLQGRVKDAVDYTGNNTTTGETTTFTGTQYEPYYAQSEGQIKSERNVTEATHFDGAINRSGVDEGTIKEKTAWDRVKSPATRNDTAAY